MNFIPSHLRWMGIGQNYTLDNVHLMSVQRFAESFPELEELVAI
jgi:hypothetical protein